MMAPRQSVAVHRKKRFRLSDSPVKMEAPIRRFFRLIFQSTMEDKKLRLPLKFAKKHGKELSETAKLTVCKGRVWEVRVKRGSNHIWFDSGWHEFAKYHSICHGHWLMFKYKGMSSFRVYIFNNSACEIPYPCNKPRNDHEDLLSSDQECRTENSDLVDISSSAAYPNTSRKKFPLLVQNPHEPSGSVRINKREGKSCNVEEHEDFVEHLSTLSPCSVPNSMKRNPHLLKGASASHAADQAARESAVQVSTMEHENSADAMKSFSPVGEIQQKQPKECGRKKLQVDPDQQLTTQPEDEADMRFAFCESASARERTATAEERERARNAAKAFEFTNPFCIVVLRPSYLYRGCNMYLPSCFAKKHLNRVSGFIKLQVSDGKECLVRCFYRGGGAQLGHGWYEFALENNLGEGDICVFELIKSRDIVLKVTVFRVLRGVGDIDLDKENHQDENDSAGAKQEREKSSKRKTFDYVYKRKGKKCKVKEEVEIIEVELINLEEKHSLGSEQGKEESAKKKRFEFEHKRKSKNSEIKEEPELIDKDENGLLGTRRERKIIVTDGLVEGLLTLSPESKRAVTSARMYKPQNHAFMVIIEPDPNGTTLHVPAAFAKMHRREISDPIRVQISDGKQWQSNWFIRPSWINHGSLILNEGWADFSLDNHLIAGDKQSFQFSTEKDYYKLTVLAAEYNINQERILQRIGRRLSLRQCRQPYTGKGFFKIILPSSIQQKKLTLPVEFVRKYGAELCNVANLILPHNQNWKVQLRKQKQKIFLDVGSSEFFKYYSIRCGFFLVFQYKGMSKFSVSIYDISACEIEYPCQEPTSNGEPCKRKVQSMQHQNEEMEDDDCISENTVSAEKEHQRKDEKQVEVIVSEKYHSLMVSSSCRRAMDAAKSYCPKNPAFRVVLGSRCNWSSYVPSKFAQKYMGMATEHVDIQDPEGTVWKMKVTRRDRGGFVFGKGWNCFFKSNNLKEEDVCVFEIMDSENFRLKVVIFPA